MAGFKQIISEFHYKKGFSPFWIIFFIPSAFYRLAIGIKNALYQIGIKKEAKMNPYVICIGNLTTGGVGKTPIVCAVADYCANVLNKKTIVLTRGYGGNIKGTKIVTDETAEETGDEAQIILKNTSNVKLVISPNRKKGIEVASALCQAEIVVMDDGFSNREVVKDFQIIVVDSKKLFGNKQLLPLGPLREPTSEIKRADRIIIADKDGDDKAICNAKSELEKYNKSISICKMEKDYYYDILSKNEICIGQKKADAVAFCGIGQPDQFYNLLNSDFNLKETMSFDDHHFYTQKDVEKIIEMAHKNNTRRILTTQKDEVKLKSLHFDTHTFWALKLKLDINLEEILNEIK